jgi:hypothetical protein
MDIIVAFHRMKDAATIPDRVTGLERDVEPTFPLKALLPLNVSYRIGLEAQSAVYSARLRTAVVALYQAGDAALDNRDWARSALNEQSGNQMVDNDRAPTDGLEVGSTAHPSASARSI